MNRKHIFITAVLLFFLGLSLTLTVYGMQSGSTNPSAEVYRKVEALSQKYKENLLLLVEHEPYVVEAKSSNAKIGEEIKGLMDFQTVQK